MTISIGQNYILHERIGSGATGVVYRGSARNSNNSVAIKILRAELAEDPDVVARFVQERTLLLRIASHYVVPVLDMVVESRTLAIVTELVSGRSLRQVLTAQGKLAPGDAASIASQTLMGLRDVHTCGIVHRDVKPANILIGTNDDGPRAMVADFGIAGLTDRATITRLTDFVGTPAYMAPELAGAHPITSAADVYAAGVVLYEMVTGRVPFTDRSFLSVLRSHAEDPVPFHPAIPEHLWQIISWLTEKDPGARPTAATAADALRSLNLPTQLTNQDLCQIQIEPQQPSTATVELGRREADPLGETIAPTPHTEVTSDPTVVPRTGVPLARQPSRGQQGGERWRRSRWWVGIAIAIVVVGTGIGGYVAMQNGQPSWSQPRQIPGASFLGGVSCSSPTFCVTSDDVGTVYVFDGKTWSPMARQISGLASHFGPHGVECTSPTFCEASFPDDGRTDLDFFDGEKWISQVTAKTLLSDGAFHLAVTTCASSRFCLAIGSNDLGVALSSVYDGRSWTRPSTLLVRSNGVTTSTQDVPYILTCVSAALCVALDGSSSPVLYSDGQWSRGRPIAGGGALTSVSCSDSTSCVAVDRTGNAYLYNGRLWSPPVHIDFGSGNNLVSISCVSEVCQAIDGAGRVVPYDAGVWGSAHEIDLGSKLTDISCASPNSCIAIDEAGRYLRFG